MVFNIKSCRLGLKYFVSIVSNDLRDEKKGILLVKGNNTRRAPSARAYRIVSLTEIGNTSTDDKIIYSEDNIK